MEYKIRFYVEELFRRAPITEKTMETREELISNLIDKYRDLIASGTSETEAYKQTVESIGNIDEILDGIGGGNVSPAPAHVNNEKNNKKEPPVLASINALIWLVALVIYFLWSFQTGAWHISWIIFIITPSLTCIATAIYRWKTDKLKGVKGLLQGSMWCAITTLYFIVSFSTGAWYITWVIFLIGGALSQIINIAYELSGRGENK